MNFTNKKLIIGITGSIAAYKAPALIREFMKHGAEVKVVATPSAEKFVSIRVLEHLTHHPVIIDMFDERFRCEGAWHVELTHWCDAMLIVPCTATTLSRLATGNCDTALSCVTIALSQIKPLILAPAMDCTMYEHSITQRNIQIVRKYGTNIIEPAEGELASGLVGRGRLPENDVILAETYNIINKFGQSKPQMLLTSTSSNSAIQATFPQLLKGKKVLITAGPTHEKIDDVRFISNYSSGKMGYALANIATAMGAEVTLISGQTSLKQPNISKFIKIFSAEELFEEVKNVYKTQEIIIMSAAVVDFKPIHKRAGKMKKLEIGSHYVLQLKSTVDILQWLGTQCTPAQYLTGFALEAENEIENAKLKLQEKNCDMLILNTANKENSGFGGDFNTITILTKEGNITDFEPLSKIKCAEIILQNIVENQKSKSFETLIV